MNLHEHREEFHALTEMVSRRIGIPSDAVRRDYYIVMMMQQLRNSDYDVTVLYPRSDIQTFLHDSGQLRSLLILTKETDRFYLSKRNVPASYDPTGPYDFDSWRNHFDSTIRRRYETLHEDLLYTSGKQNFADAIQTFEAISRIFASIGQ